MTVPKILKFGTIFENENGKIELNGFSFLGNSGDFLGSCVDAVIARLKEEPCLFADFKYKAQEQYITAEEARKLGAGKAEYESHNGEWLKLDPDFYAHKNVFDDLLKYRAIKQPEPEKSTNFEYDGHKNYSNTEPVEPHAELKANLVKLDGELMTREAAWRKISLSDKDLFYLWDDSIEWLLSEVKSCGELNNYNFRGDEYQLRAKQPKLIPLDWKDVPPHVAVTYEGVVGFYVGSFIDRDGKSSREVLFLDNQGYGKDLHTFDDTAVLKLAPAAEQPWISVQDDDQQAFVKICFDLIAKGIQSKGEPGRFKVTGLVSGYGYPEQKGGC